MDLTGTTHISNSYLPNSRADISLVRGQRNTAMEQTSALRGPNVTECNIGVPNVISSSTAANRRDPTAYLVPVSKSERLLCTSVSQQNNVECSAQSDFVNPFNSPHHPVSS